MVSPQQHQRKTIMATKNPKPAQPPTTKPAAAKPAAPPPAAEPDEDLDTDVDDSDDDDGAPAGDGETAAAKKRNWMATQRLPAPKREAVLVANLVNKLSRRLDTITNWPGPEMDEVRKSMQTAIDSMKDASQGMAKLPESYKAKVPASSGPAKELKPGSIIRITEKKVSDYEGILEPEQMRGIKVIELRGNKVVAQAGDLKVMLARGHVALDTEAA
jgi:hypothetical protein